MSKQDEAREEPKVEDKDKESEPKKRRLPRRPRTGAPLEPRR